MEFSELETEIDNLFQSAILSIDCLDQGKFIFQGADGDRAFDQLVGFSNRQHRKRTMGLYRQLEQSALKMSYMLLGSVLESAYYLLKEYSHQREDSQRHFSDAYKTTFFNKFNDPNSAIRYLKLANGTGLIANIFKHNNGLIENKDSGKHFIKLIDHTKLKDGSSLFLLPDGIEIAQINILNLRAVIAGLYICICDIKNSIFAANQKENTDLKEALKNLIHYQIHQEYNKCLQAISKSEGTFILVDPAE